MFHNVPGVYELYKADSGAIRFKVRYPTGMGFAVFTLTCKDKPSKDLYQVFFGPTYRFVDVTVDGEHESRRFNLDEPITREFREIWLTWHTGVICMGIDGSPDPMLIYADPKIPNKNIGFIKFYVKSVRWPVEWQFEASPVILPSLKEKKFEEGALRWVTYDTSRNDFPTNALIGGFEGEPLYIARSLQNGSMCPGKYIRSQRCAYLPWGGSEYSHEQVQILTGFNARWVKTKGNFIPDNAFVAGFSEVRREPLYIGRAMFDDNLLVGKVHVLYQTCYLPYKGKEVEVYSYEILVSREDPRAVLPPAEEKQERRPPRPLVL